MRVYVGIDMAKDKFDYCTVDDDMNILYRGSNCSNSSESFDSLKKNIEYLKSMASRIYIGMESTGIYHLPLYRYLRDRGFHVRILNGLEVRGMKKSRVRKTTNDSIDSESIARYLMVSKDKDSYDYPDELRNLQHKFCKMDRPSHCYVPLWPFGNEINEAVTSLPGIWHFFLYFITGW